MRLFYGLLWLAAANAVIGVVCGGFQSRAWARWLLLVATLTTLGAVVWIVKIIAENAHSSESTAGIYGLPGLPLLLELPWLLCLYLGARSYRKRRP